MTAKTQIEGSLRRRFDYFLRELSDEGRDVLDQDWAAFESVMRSTIRILVNTKEDRDLAAEMRTS